MQYPTVLIFLRHLVWLHMQTVLESAMLLCEVTAFTCSILALKWKMNATGVYDHDHTHEEVEEGYDDMALYSVMCSISTFCAVLITVTLLIVPEHVCTGHSLHAYHLLMRTPLRFHTTGYLAV